MDRMAHRREMAPLELLPEAVAHVNSPAFFCLEKSNPTSNIQTDVILDRVKRQQIHTAVSFMCLTFL